jgi:hypothetical protein
MTPIQRIGTTVFLVLVALTFTSSPRAATLVAAEKRTDNIITHLSEGRYDDVAALFGPKLAEALPVDRLRSTWVSLGANLGSLEDVQLLEGKITSNGLAITKRRLRFAAYPIIMTVTYRNMDVAGIFFKAEAPLSDLGK